VKGQRAGTIGPRTRLGVQDGPARSPAHALTLPVDAVDSDMKLAIAVLGFLGAADALVVPTTAPTRAGAIRMAAIGDTGVSFENVAREWRCKYTAGASGGPGDSASLKACQELLTEYLPKIKALPKASVTRQVGMFESN